MLYDQRDSFPPATARTAELLHAQTERFEVLLADLLEMSRYDAGAVQLEVEPTNLVRLVEDAIEAVMPLADEKDTEIRLVAPGGYFEAEVDARRIRRILQNLLGNAIDHGEGRPIVVYVDSDADAVAIAVRDYGVGLAAADMARVFDRFWRADPSRQRSTGGTGLGLAISQEDAIVHGGELDVWSEPGRGSCFRLTIPRHRGELHRAVAARPAARRRHRPGREEATAVSAARRSRMTRAGRAWRALAVCWRGASASRPAGASRPRRSTGRRRPRTRCSPARRRRPRTPARRDHRRVPPRRSRPAGQLQVAREYLTDDFQVELGPRCPHADQLDADLADRARRQHLVGHGLGVGARRRPGPVPDAAPADSYDLTFGLVQERRRSVAHLSAPDGTVLSPNRFASIFDPYELYFFDPSFEFLVPDLRWFRPAATVARQRGRRAAGRAERPAGRRCAVLGVPDRHRAATAS